MTVVQKPWWTEKRNQCIIHIKATQVDRNKGHTRGLGERRRKIWKDRNKGS